MNILILGGNGFIGSNLAHKLLLKGHSITIFGKKNSNRIKNCTFIEGDFINIKKYAEMFSNIDVVYHLISTTVPQTSNIDPIFDIESNVVKTVELLQLCVEKGIKKVIYASSGGTIYGIPKNYPISETHQTNPICSYGITKLMIEKYMGLFYRRFGLEYAIVRLSNPYGPWQKSESIQGVIGVFIGKIFRNEPITIWGDGSIVRDYIFIDDAVEAMAILADRKVLSNIFNLGSGLGVSLNELINLLQAEMNQKIVVEYQQGRSFDIPINILDISKIEKELSWKCKYDLKKGIKETIKWWNSTF